MNNDVKYLTIVRLLLGKMNEEITYCHWKSNQHFSDALSGIDDLDILIERTEYGKLSSILKELNFKRFYTPEARTYVGIEDYLGFDGETGKIVHLHLHCQLVVGEKHLKGFVLPIENTILQNRVWNDEYKAYLSSPFDELLLLILRISMKNRKRDLLKKKVAEKNALIEYEWLKEMCPDFCVKLNNQIWLTERIKQVIKYIYTNGFSWMKCCELKHYLYNDFACYSQGNACYNTVKRHKREFSRIILEIKKRYLKSNNTFLRRRSATGGVLIAFLGSDGAGKSSAIAEMRKWLLKVMDVRYFYLGSGDGNSSLIRMPLKIAKKIGQRMGIIKITNNFNDKDLSEKNNKEHKLSLARKLWIYTLSKERIKKLVTASRCRLRGYVVLTDRYPQNEFDGLCDGPKLRGKKGVSARKEEEAFRIAQISAPDLVIKLIVSPETAMQRKPGEIDYETSYNLTERVKKIKFSEKTKIVEIDANQSQEQVWADIKRAIWNII